MLYKAALGTREERQTLVVKRLCWEPWSDNDSMESDSRIMRPSLHPMPQEAQYDPDEVSMKEVLWVGMRPTAAPSYDSRECLSLAKGRV